MELDGGDSIISSKSKSMPKNASPLIGALVNKHVEPLPVGDSLFTETVEDISERPPAHTTSVKNAHLLMTNLFCEPFTLYQRKPHKIQQDIRYPVNPIRCPRKSLLPARRSIVTLQEFCKMRSIPFSDNEDRFYKFLRSGYLKSAFQSLVDM